MNGRRGWWNIKLILPWIRYLFLSIRCSHYESLLLYFHWFSKLLGALNPWLTWARWRCTHWHTSSITLFRRWCFNLFISILWRITITIVVILHWCLHGCSLFLERSRLHCEWRLWSDLWFRHWACKVIHYQDIVLIAKISVTIFFLFKFAYWGYQFVAFPKTPYLK